MNQTTATNIPQVRPASPYMMTDLGSWDESHDVMLENQDESRDVVPTLKEAPGCLMSLIQDAVEGLMKQAADEVSIQHVASVLNKRTPFGNTCVVIISF